MQCLVDLPVAICGDIPEYFVDGIARIEVTGDCLRFTLFVYSADDDSGRCAEVAIVTPITSVHRQAMQSAAAAEAASFGTIH